MANKTAEELWKETARLLRECQRAATEAANQANNCCVASAEMRKQCMLIEMTEKKVRKSIEELHNAGGN